MNNKMIFKEDNTFFEIREKSVLQWLEEMKEHDDITVRGGVKATEEYIKDLKKQIAVLEDKCSLKDKYLTKLRSTK